MGALDGLKTIWADPKKRPIVLAAGGVATGAGILAMKRPVEPEAAALEDQEAALAGEGTDPLMTDPGGAGVGYGTLPPVYAMGGGGDAAFQEQDLSGIYAEMDGLQAGFQDKLDAAMAAERAKNKKARKGQGRRLSQAEKRLQAQRKRNKKQDKAIARLKNRGRSKKPAGRGKDKRRPNAKARRAARARGVRSTRPGTNPNAPRGSKMRHR
jgi:hypothetical protein